MREGIPFSSNLALTALHHAVRHDSSLSGECQSVVDVYKRQEKGFFSKSCASCASENQFTVIISYFGCGEKGTRRAVRTDYLRIVRHKMAGTGGGCAVLEAMLEGWRGKRVLIVGKPDGLCAFLTAMLEEILSLIHICAGRDSADDDQSGKSSAHGRPKGHAGSRQGRGYGAAGRRVERSDDRRPRPRDLYRVKGMAQFHTRRAMGDLL